MHDKELFVIAGSPGSGKSAILRMIAGLEDPDEGEIYMDDEPITSIPPHKRSVFMIFQSLALYPNRTVFENIAFPLKVRKLPEREIKKKVEETAAFLRIGHILNKYPRFLSGGEQQRVAIARAMVVNPKLYLFDQPLANLDALIRSNMREELRRIAKQLGTTTIYATHDSVEAISIADRIAYLEKGKLIEIGTPEEILNNPRDYRVARYFSDINLYETEVKEINGKYAVELFSQNIVLKSDKLYPGQRVIVVFKTNDAMLGDEGRIEDEMVWRAGEITIAEEHVRSRVYSIELEGGQEVRVFSKLRYNLGDRVSVGIPINRLMVFDKEKYSRLV